MVLTIDVGNTNIKCGLFDNEKLLTSWRISSDQKRTSDEYGLSFVNLVSNAGFSVEDIEGIIISSVIPSLNYTLDHMCRYYFHRKPIFVASGIKTGLNIKYDNPKEVGSDRIAVSVAAVKEYGSPLIVIDFGTATTVNVIGGNNEFLGGLICPGVKTSVDTLVNNTAKLPRIELINPQKIVGKNTVSNMQSGIFYGFIGMIEYIVNRIKEEESLPNAQVVATGGLSELVAEGTKIFDYIDRRLSLKGLYYLYKQNS